MLERLVAPDRNCAVMKMHDSLEPKDQAIFAAAINDSESWGAHTLSIELGKAGLKIAKDTIMRHRRGACRCLKI